jgi:arylsulfatase
MNKLKRYLFEILLLFFTISIPYTLGTSETVGGMIASFLIFIVFRYINYWLFAILFSFIALTCALLLPATIWFGYPTITMISAFLETNFQEAKEFTQSLPLYAYILSIAILFFAGYILYLGKKKRYLYNKKSILITSLMAVAAIVLTIERPIRKWDKKKGFEFRHSHTLIFSFYDSLYKDITAYYELRKNIGINVDLLPSWKIESVTPHYQDYVLVIGESVRRDYMSLYGFPVENSNFLKTVKGTVLDGFTSTAANTTNALLRMFIQMKGVDFVYENNIISLAKQAGFETFWISNQGLVGEWDTPMASLSSLADHRKFMKLGHYESKLVYDSGLLTPLKEYLAFPITRPRLFILHLVGSHPLFEQRLETPLHYNYYNANLSSYIQTIEQTDKLLEQIYQTLQAQNHSFSLLYFSDHGLETKDRNSPKASLAHGTSKASFRVPFVIINSNDTLHKEVHINKSGYHFIEGFAQWLGIKESSLNSSYNFLSPPSDTLKVFTGEYVPFNSLIGDTILSNNKK